MKRQLRLFAPIPKTRVFGEMLNSVPRIFPPLLRFETVREGSYIRQIVGHKRSMDIVDLKDPDAL